jgi:hypothetical protein
VIHFAKTSGGLTVTLRAAEGGSLRMYHKRLKASLVGKICEKDGLRANDDSLDPNGDEFSVAEMIIEREES